MYRNQYLRVLTIFILLFITGRVLAQDAPSDCIKARVLTNKLDVVVDGSTFGDVGAFDEPGSCFGQAERSPYWFKFEVCKAGTLSAYIDPEGTSDFDFVLFDITEGCGAKVEVSCNFETSTGTANITGIGCDNPPSCNPLVNVEAGHTYAMVFNRYTFASQAGFTLSLGGSCEFTDPSQLNFQPEIFAPTIVCGSTGQLESLVPAGYDNVQWSATGAGTLAFDLPTELNTGFSASAPGVYRVYLTAFKLICDQVFQLKDSVDIEVKGIVPLYGDGALTICETTVQLTNLSGVLGGTPPSGGYWSDDNNSGRIDAQGRFTGFGAGGSVFTFTYHTPSNENCDVTQASATITVNEELTVTLDSVSCFNSGADFRVFTHISGGTPASYTVNDLVQADPYFSSGFLPNQFQYSFEIKDQSGCAPVIVTGTKDCNCTNNAGTLVEAYTVDCEAKSVTVQHNNNEQLEVGDVLNYVVYTDAANPSTSIIYKTTSPTIVRQPSMLVGEKYYVAAAVADDLGAGEVDLTDPCLSLSKGVKVLFPGNGEVQFSGDTLICEGGSATLTFNVSGNYNIVGAYTADDDTVSFFLEPGVTSISVSPKTTTTYGFGNLTDVLGCPVVKNGGALVEVSQIPAFSYKLINDSVVCGTQSGSPFLLFNTLPNEELTVSYTVNDIIQPPLTGVGNNFLFNVPKTTVGKHTLQVTAIASTISGCYFLQTYPPVNYYYLDAPTVNLSSSKLEFCNPNEEALVKFTYEENLPIQVFYHINQSGFDFVLEETTDVSYPVDLNLNFRLDSAKFIDFPTCVFPISGVVDLTYFTQPELVIEKSMITCTNATAQVVIHAVESNLLYSLDGSPYTTDTIYEFTTPGNKQLITKRGQSCLYNQSVEVVEVEPFTLNTSVSATSCGQANGQIIPELGGVFEIPITYSFNGGANNTGLAAGSYTVVAVDATGCEVIAYTVVPASEPFIFQGNATVIADCDQATKGTVVLEASGGNGNNFYYSNDGITFTNDNTFTELDPTFHWFYARNDVGCSDSIQIKVKATEELQIGINLLNYLKCYESHDAVVRVTVANSTETLVYSNNNGAFGSSNLIENLGPGNQTFYAMETTGCKRGNMISFNMTRPEKLTLTIQSQGNPTCFNSNNGFFALKVFGGANLNYKYTVDGGVAYGPNANIGGLAPGNYTLIAVNSNQCSTDTLFSTLESTPPIVIDNIETTYNPDGTTGNITITASGGDGPLTYSINGFQFYSTNIFVSQPKGTYMIIVRDANGCEVKREILLDNVGVAEFNAESGMVVYPNPVANKLVVSFEIPVQGVLEIRNFIGQLMAAPKELTQKEYVYDASSWSPGVYVIQVKTPDGVYFKKIVKQ